MSSLIRTRWAAIGAAVAVTLGGGGVMFVDAAKDSGERPVTVMLDEPCRIRDTRPDKNIGRDTPLGEAEAYEVTTQTNAGDCATKIPADAVGLVTNVTAVDATLNTNLRLYPKGAALPEASNLNPRGGGDPVTNAVTVGVDGSGVFIIRNNKGTVHVIIDVAGYLVDHTHDDRYVSSQEDTYFYIPGSLLRLHYLYDAATVEYDATSNAIVRKTGSPGRVDVVIPLPLPNELGAKWAKLVNFRISYQVDNASSYIDNTWLNKSDNGGGIDEIADDSTNRSSTTYTSYVVGCDEAACQLSWVPNGNYLTVRLNLEFAGTGSAHDITIGGVLMRVSYDG